MSGNCPLCFRRKGGKGKKLSWFRFIINHPWISVGFFEQQQNNEMFYTRGQTCVGHFILKSQQQNWFEIAWSDILFCMSHSKCGLHFENLFLDICKATSVSMLLCICPIMMIEDNASFWGYTGLCEAMLDLLLIWRIFHLLGEIISPNTLICCERLNVFLH